ncbi:MAG: translation initiation factor IF-3 [Armatimonadetes bacterium]|nr:translation initiation factor IF-3 [Armatimonadota bacterium]
MNDRNRRGRDPRDNRDVPRINERIRAPQVRVIDADGKQLGILTSRQANDIARSRDLDLVEVAPLANPPVCRIIDYGKYKYEQSKREGEARKRQKTADLKGIRMRPRIDEHDLMTKVGHARKFLLEGDKVKVTMLFRSREASHPEFARKSMDRLADEVKDVGQIERPPVLEGRQMIMILSPRTAT